MSNLTRLAFSRARTVTALAVATCLLFAACVPASAWADFGVANFNVSATNQDGTADSQAGSHPYELTTSFAFNLTTDAQGDSVTDGQVKDVQVALPPGIVGNPTTVPQCLPQNLQQTLVTAGVNGCPIDSQIGMVTLHLKDRFLPATAYVPLYNMAPPAGTSAEFGFNMFGIGVYMTVEVRTGQDYGLTISSPDISAAFEVAGLSVAVWGIPEDPTHNAQRCPDSNPFTGQCTGSSYGNEPHPAGIPLKPFLTLPTSCGAPLIATIRADSWLTPELWQTASSTLPAPTGCDKLGFVPSLIVRPNTMIADSPSGLSVDLQVPQAGLVNPTGLAAANLKDATVTLPQGVSVNPSSANGLAACSPAQIGINNANEPSCPDAAKVGTVEVDTPLLPDPLKGGVYVAQQDNNPFNSLLAIYVTAYADGVWVKLAGHVVADPVTGQLQTTFDNNPQLAFSDFKLDFFGGPLAALATPDACGTYMASSQFTPWSGTAPVSSSNTFEITSGCVSGFAPSFTAGTQNAQAGAYSPFVLSMSRSDVDQSFSGLAVKLPPGMLAKLAGVQECSEQQVASISSAPGTGAAQAANPSCPASSQVGTVQVGVGAGPEPFFLPGTVYLTGAYKGASYGLAVVVPAVAGPYDLGTVVVRQALYVDPTTAQVTDVSDPFPTILDGIPLRIRRVDVNLNRPDFTVNPTSCDPMSVGGILSSTGGLLAGVSSRFQVGGCASLGFSPKLHMRLTGRGQTHSGTHPTLTATLTQAGVQANLASARVALPLSLALDPNNSQHVCSYDVAEAVHGGAVGCPASTIVGSATAYTPLLSQPLTGKVYLVQGIRFGKAGQRIRTLPSLLIPLRGQIALDLRAKSSVNGAQELVTTFPTIPDAPVSKFSLTINGGRRGILVITGRGRTVCGKPQVANAQFGAQSGKQELLNPRLGTPACRGFHAKKHGKKHPRKHSSRRAADVAYRRV